MLTSPTILFLFHQADSITSCLFGLESIIFNDKHKEVHIFISKMMLLVRALHSTGKSITLHSALYPWKQFTNLYLKKVNSFQHSPFLKRYNYRRSKSACSAASVYWSHLSKGENIMLEQFYKDCRNELIGWCTTLTHDPLLA